LYIIVGWDIVWIRKPTESSSSEPLKYHIVRGPGKQVLRLREMVLRLREMKYSTTAVPRKFGVSNEMVIGFIM
jgi:hypothetical protein